MSCNLVSNGTSLKIYDSFLSAIQRESERIFALSKHVLGCVTVETTETCRSSLCFFGI